MQYEVSCKGFSPGVCEDEYLAQYYSQVRESENWTEAEVSDITYVYGYVTSAEIPIDHASEKWRKPKVILTVDHQGQMTPMATGVMLVKDIAGKACSRVLEVLYNSGGSKSMCHSRVIPTGARIRTNK